MQPLVNIDIQFNYVEVKPGTLSSVMLVKQITPCLRDPSPDGSGRRAGGTLKFKVAGTLPRPSRSQLHESRYHELLFDRLTRHRKDYKRMDAFRNTRAIWRTGVFFCFFHTLSYPFLSVIPQTPRVSLRSFSLRKLPQRRLFATFLLTTE